jgi:extracellular solute-binding protein
MKKLKVFLSALLITTAAFSISACGNGSSDSNSGDENKYEDQTMPPEKREQIVERINGENGSLLQGELSNKTIKWMATWDINPDASGKNTPADLVIFQEAYGGNIEFHSVSFEERYDKLANAINSDEGIDFFYAGDLDAIPKGAVRGMFVPADDYIDFESPLWKDVKEVNDSIMWDGKHYTAVAQMTGDVVAAVYNRKTIQEAGLEDPADLYKKDEWTWDAFQSMLESFVDTDNQRYGIDGWWFEFGLIDTIGMPPIAIEDGKLVSNLSDPSMERVQNWLYELHQKDFIAIGSDGYGWEAKPNYIGEGKLLFYPVGLYEFYSKPEIWKEKYGEDVFFVPMPRDPEADAYYTSAGMEAYSFVKGGQNPEGVAKYLDCKRFCIIDEESCAIADSAFTDDYGWTEEMVEMRAEMNRLASENPVVDISRGVSADCGTIIDNSLRQTARGVPWNETYDSIYATVQSYIDETNEEIGK